MIYLDIYVEERETIKCPHQKRFVTLRACKRCKYHHVVRNGIGGTGIKVACRFDAPDLRTQFTKGETRLCVVHGHKNAFRVKITNVVYDCEAREHIITARGYSPVDGKEMRYEYRERYAKRKFLKIPKTKTVAVYKLWCHRCETYMYTKKPEVKYCKNCNSKYWNTPKGVDERRGRPRTRIIPEVRVPSDVRIVELSRCPASEQPDPPEADRQG